MVELSKMHIDYHINHSAANEHWPNSMWALYKINGDKIADCVVREHVNPKGWYEGKVIARHSWCGYIGGFHSLAELMAAIEADMTERAARS